MAPAVTVYCAKDSHRCFQLRGESMGARGRNQFIFALAFGVSSLAIGVEKGRGCKGCRTRRGRPPAKERAFVTPPGAIYEKVPARPSFSATAKAVGLVSPKLTARRGRGQGPFLFLAFPIAMALALEDFLTRPKCWLEKFLCSFLAMGSAHLA